MLRPGATAVVALVCSMVGMLTYMNSQTGQNPALDERRVDGEALSRGQLAAEEAFGDLFEQGGFGGDTNENTNSAVEVVHHPSGVAAPIAGSSISSVADSPTKNVRQPPADVSEIDAALKQPVSTDARGIMSQIVETKKLLAEAQAELEAMRSSSADLAGVLPRTSPSKLTKVRRAKAPPVTFLKTHKTGSTTIGSIFFRHAARYGMVLSPEGLVVDNAEATVAKAVQEHDTEVGRSYDYFLSHLTTSGGKFKYLRRAGINQMFLFFNAALRGLAAASKDAADAAQPPPMKMTSVTVIRNPASRIRSHFDYYLRSTGKFTGSFGQWLDEDHDISLRNFQCTEMGLYNEKDLSKFLKATFTEKPSSADLTAPHFDFVMVLERMDECLVLLRRLLKRSGWDWDLLDLIHIDQPMSTNWKGQKVTKSDLSAVHKKLCMERSSMDAQLWVAAGKRLDELIAIEKKRDGDSGRGFEVELVAYKLLQRELAAQCRDVTPLGPFKHNAYKKGPAKWKAGPAIQIPANLCLWYGMDDVTYVNFIQQFGGDITTLFTPQLDEQLMQVRDAVLAAAGN